MRLSLAFSMGAVVAMDSGARDFTQGNAADAASLTIVTEYKAALGPGPETGPVNRDSGFRAINWDPAAASNAGVTQNSGVNTIFPVRLSTHSHLLASLPSSRARHNPICV